VPERLPDFRPILAALNANNVRFIVIGGLAMTVYGSAHVTEDIDLGYDRSRDNIKAITQALKEFQPRFTNFPDELPFVWDEKTLRAAANITLDASSGGESDSPTRSPNSSAASRSQSRSLRLAIGGRRPASSARSSGHGYSRSPKRKPARFPARG
jgi:hypothetical protein